MTTKPEYVYVALIGAPPERVWHGLTSPEFTRRYWHGTRVMSDFAVGSPIVFLVDGDDDGEKNRDEVACEGEVLAADPPCLLSYTWRFPRDPETAREPPSRVTFRLEKAAGGTRLTVIHDRFEAGSKTYRMVSQGWPAVISGLKTLLETGRAIDFSRQGGES